MSDEPIVRFEHADIVFGNRPETALPLIDEGRSRAEIQAETGQILGVANASLEVHEGETLVLMGLSGSGKSTLLRAVNGLNRLTRGSVKLRLGDGWIEPQSASQSELRQMRLSSVSMVFQQFALLPWRTVEHNIGLGLEFAGVDRAEIASRVAKQLALVGLEGWGEKRVQELSGGMQQRVGLARAFVTDAPILLMDEPYSALDPLIRARLQDELIDLQNRLQRTIVFVSHDLDEAIKIGNRIAIMEGGRIIQCGEASEILNHPANEYVADFVAHMNPLRVCRAIDAMRPASRRADGEGKAREVGADTPLREVMELQLATALPVYVRDDTGIIGRIDAGDVQRTLLR